MGQSNFVILKINIMTMNKITPITAVACLIWAVSCTGYQEDEAFTGGDISPELTPESSTSQTIDKELFDVLNLDYPGLSKVKAAIEAEDTTTAMTELLEYWRERPASGPVNPNVNLISASISASDRNIADQALEYRFYIRNFHESKTDDGVETYYKFTDDKGNINWNYVPNGVTDQEFRYQLHRHQWFEPLAKAYRTSRDEKYFQSWMETYRNWLKKFPCPTGTVFPPPGGAENDVDYQWKGLQVAERVLSQINILPYFIYSDNFTHEWLATVLVEFAKAVELMRLNYYPDSNILVTQSQAVGYAGLLMPEFKNAGEWATEGFRKLGDAVKEQFLADGIHYELDPSYHISAIADILESKNLAELNNKPELITNEFIDNLHEPVQFVKDIIWPDYTIDNWNDTRSSSYPKNVLIKNFKSYSALFPEDQELKWMATEGAEGTMPVYTAKAYDKGGYYMLRTGWDKNSPTRSMMILKSCYDTKNLWHNQPDNGTFGLWHNGRNFFPDAGCFAYSGSTKEEIEQRKKYAETKNHNTVTLQSKDYGADFRRGTLRKIETRADGMQILVVDNQIDANTGHRRSVFQIGSIFTIVDEVFETGEQTSTKVNLNFHLATPAQFDASDAETLKEYAAYTTFEDGNNIYMRTFSEVKTFAFGGNDFNVTTSTTNRSDKLREVSGTRNGYQYTIRKAKGKAARLVTVIVPYSGDSVENINIKAEFTDNEAGAEGTFHENGPAVKLTINESIVNLTYNLSENANNENN